MLNCPKCGQLPVKAVWVADSSEGDEPALNQPVQLRCADHGWWVHRWEPGDRIVNRLATLLD